MDTRTLGAILLKVAGLVMITYCVSQVPGYLPLASRGNDWSFAEVAGAIIVGLGPLAVLGAGFWLFPGKLANHIVSPPSPEPAPEPEPGRLESIALAVLGLFLIASALTELVRNVVYIAALYRQSPDAGLLPASVIARLAGLLAELAIGAVLCIGAPAVWRLIERLRG